jgi:hypothetical protein
MYKMRIGDSDPEYVHTDVYETEEELFRGVAEKTLEKLEDCEEPSVYSLFLKLLDKRDTKGLVKLYNDKLYEPANGDFMEVEMDKRKKPTYGSKTIEQIRESACRMSLENDG